MKIKYHRIWFVLVACCLILLVISFAANGFPVLGEAAIGQRPQKNPKLSTLLVLLSMNVKQETARPTVAEAVRPPAGFSTDKLPKPLQDAMHAGQMHVTNNGEVQVYIEVNTVDPQNLDELRSFGVTVQIIGRPNPDKAKGEVLTAVPTVQALLPITMIDQVASLPFVRYIRLPDYAVKSTGSVDSQGDGILKANLVRQQFGLDGTGVRVGVISDGIGGIFAMACTTCGPTTAIPSPITSSDLPNATGTRNSTGVLTSVSAGIIAQSFPSSSPNLEPPASDTASGVGAEGTAMLEIVHDLAPGAQLYFANPADGTSLSFQQAVSFLAANTDVVVDDISFHTPPFDGTSGVSINTSTALNTDGNPIRGYFTAVANQAFNHWGEAWTPAGVTSTLTCPNGIATTGDVQLFQATSNTVDAGAVGPHAWNPFLLLVPPGATVTVILTWDDPDTGSSNDYDLFLYPLLGNGLASSVSLACSINPQTGTQPPVEGLAYTNNSGATQQVGILIQNFNNAAAARNFDMFVAGIGNGKDLNFYTPSGSVPAQADAGGSPVSVVSVGATDAQIDASGHQPATVIEPYSSQGPTEATPQAAARMKPDVTATDGVSVTGAGGFGFADTLATSPCPANNPSPPGCYFFGSSAASPHAAAIAALVLQAAPCLLSKSTVNTPATARAHLRNFLTSTAIPLPGISQAVPNNIEGFGLLNALAAVTAAMPTANAGVAQTVNGTSANGATTTLDGSASSDPDSCPLLSFNWSGACGTASGMKPTVTCPLGANTETLTVSNGGATTGLPTSTVQVTVSDFTDTASPPSATVSPGQTASHTVTIGSKFGAFTSPVSLACSGLPALSSCAFSPANVTPGPSSAASTLTISTTAPSSVFPLIELRKPNAPIFVLWLVLLFALTSLAVFAGRSERKPCFAFAICALLVCLVVPILSCGGGSSGPRNPGTPAGTYSVTVTGTSNQLQRSTSVSLTVQ